MDETGERDTIGKILKNLKKDRQSELDSILHNEVSRIMEIIRSNIIERAKAGEKNYAITFRTSARFFLSNQHDQITGKMIVNRIIKKLESEDLEYQLLKAHRRNTEYEGGFEFWTSWEKFGYSKEEMRRDLNYVIHHYTLVFCKHSNSHFLPNEEENHTPFYYEKHSSSSTDFTDWSASEIKVHRLSVDYRDGDEISNSLHEDETYAAFIIRLK